MRIFVVGLSLAISGCSIHPLPDRVTGLSTYEIVHKIRCEARETIKQLFESSGLSAQAPSLLLADTEIKSSSRQITKLQDDLAKLSRKLKRLEIEDGELEDISAGLRKRVEAKEAKIKAAKSEQLVAEAQKSDSSIVSDYNNFATRKTDHLREMSAYDTQRRLVTARIMDLEDKLALDTDTRSDKYKALVEFLGIGLVYNFRFQITENNDATAKGSFSWPVSLGTVSLGYDIGEKKSRLAEREVKLVVTFGELIQMNCDPVPQEASFRYPISGKIGLDEVIHQYMAVAKDSKFKTAGESYRDKIQFTTTLNGSVNPGFSLVRVSGVRLGSDATLGARRDDLHEVTILLYPYVADKVPAPTKMEITNIAQMPDLRVKVLDAAKEAAR